MQRRNLKDEMPKGIPFTRAVELLTQGYTVQRVHQLTGFPLQLLAAQLKQKSPARAAQVPIPVSRRVEAQDDRIPLHVAGEISVNAAEYSFTAHAIARMLERGITYKQVAEVISSKGKVVTSCNEAHLPTAWRYLLGELSVVVDPATRVVITVSWRHEPHQAASA